MKYSGEYFEPKGDGDYSKVTVRVNPDEIMDELGRSINHMKRKIENLENEIKQVKNEKFADETIKKLQEENEKLKLDYHRGFPISEDEDKKIKEWIDKWMTKHKVTIQDMGAIGGGFTYKFTPTSIGTSGVVIAPNGDEFEFQEIN